MKTLTLIDANSIIHRAYHALPPFTAPDGRPTGALYGLSMMLLRMQSEGLLEYAAALFDRPEPTFREKRYAAYKATRPETAEPLIDQIIEAHRLFGAFGVATFEKAGYEADDGIATLAERFRHEPDTRVVIVTGDMDTLQLVEDPRVAVRAFRRGVTDTITYDESGVCERLGVPASAVTSYKALVGDPSDNIKGVSGIGPKTAAELIVKYGSLEGIVKHLDELPEGARGKIRTQRAEAELAKELVTLDRHVPLEIGPFESLKIGERNNALRTYFANLGFTRLIARLDAPEGARELGEPAKKQGKEKKAPRGPNPAQRAMF